MSAARLGIGQLSYRYTVHPSEARDDFHWVLGQQLDGVGFTEVTQFHAQLMDACSDRGYSVFLPPEGDTALAVRGDHHVTGHGYAHVNAGQTGHGRHTPRGVQTVEFTPAGTRERVTLCEAHWLTQRSDPHGHQRLAMVDAMGQAVRDAAHGSRLGFWLGDTNNPDRPSATSDVDRALRKAALTSCWDELGRYPDTHGDHTLDVVGSYDPDVRVSCIRARTFPRLHSDHRPIGAWYSIRPRKR